MPPIVVHQSKEYFQYINYIIPIDWIIFHTPSGYVDIAVWFKDMDHLSTLCDASPFNNDNILFNGHDSHFDDYSFHCIETQNMQPFTLKSGDSVNHQTKKMVLMKN